MIIFMAKFDRLQPIIPSSSMLIRTAAAVTVKILLNYVMYEMIERLVICTVALMNVFMSFIFVSCYEVNCKLFIL